MPNIRSRFSRLPRLISLLAVILCAIGLSTGFMNGHESFFSTSLPKASSALNNPDIAKEIRLHSHHHPAEAAAKVTSTPDKTARIGLHVENIYSLSLKDKSYMIEGWYWLKWPKEMNEIAIKSNINSSKFIEFTNEIEASSMTVEPIEAKPVEQADGGFFQTFRFSGKLYVDNVYMHWFPFLKLDLPIMIELRPDEFSCYPQNTHGCYSLLLDPMPQGSVMGQFTDLNGYDGKGVAMVEFLHQYPSNFGFGNLSAFNSVRFDVIYSTNFIAAFGSYIFPLLLLIGVAIVAPSLPSSLGDVRLAIPTTILLTLIFLQLGYKSELPPLAYLILLDWLYIYAYLLTAILFGLFCWAINVYEVASSAGPSFEAAAAQRINRVDFAFQLSSVVALLIGLTIVVILRF